MDVGFGRGVPLLGVWLAVWGGCIASVEERRPDTTKNVIRQWKETVPTEETRVVLAAATTNLDTPTVVATVQLEHFCKDLFYEEYRITRTTVRKPKRLWWGLLGTAVGGGGGATLLALAPRMSNKPLDSSSDSESKTSARTYGYAFGGVLAAIGAISLGSTIYALLGSIDKKEVGPLQTGTTAGEPRICKTRPAASGEIAVGSSSLELAERQVARADQQGRISLDLRSIPGFRFPITAGPHELALTANAGSTTGRTALTLGDWVTAPRRMYEACKTHLECTRTCAALNCDSDAKYERVARLLKDKTRFLACLEGRDLAAHLQFIGDTRDEDRRDRAIANYLKLVSANAADPARQLADIDALSSSLKSRPGVGPTILGDIKRVRDGIVVYTGKTKDGKRFGPGMLVYGDGRKYVGLFRDDKFHGRGTFTYPDGGTYVGQYKDGKRDGQGTYTGANGYKYAGQYKDDKPNGRGEESWTDGSRCVGQYRDGESHGFATWTNAKGGKYVGQWKGNQFHGQGTFTLPTGSAYVGQYKDGKPNGQGTHTWANGDKYVGEWKDGQEHGQGTKTWADGDKYVGEWKTGSRHGHGAQTFADGRVLTGNWKDGWSPWQEGTWSFSQTKYRTPQEMYVYASRLEMDDKLLEAKIVYEHIVSRYPTHPLTIKATDRLREIRASEKAAKQTAERARQADAQARRAAAEGEERQQAAESRERDRERLEDQRERRARGEAEARDRRQREAERAACHARVRSCRANCEGYSDKSPSMWSSSPRTRCLRECPSSWSCP